MSTWLESSTNNLEKQLGLGPVDLVVSWLLQRRKLPMPPFDILLPSGVTSHSDIAAHLSSSA